VTLADFARRNGTGEDLPFVSETLTADLLALRSRVVQTEQKSNALAAKDIAVVQQELVDEETDLATVIHLLNTLTWSQFYLHVYLF
jgi:hypothetical protein